MPLIWSCPFLASRCSPVPPAGGQPLRRHHCARRHLRRRAQGALDFGPLRGRHLGVHGGCRQGEGAAWLPACCTAQPCPPSVRASPPVNGRLRPCSLLALQAPEFIQVSQCARGAVNSHAWCTAATPAAAGCLCPARLQSASAGAPATLRRSSTGTRTPPPSPRSPACRCCRSSTREPGRWGGGRARRSSSARPVSAQRAACALRQLGGAACCGPPQVRRQRDRLLEPGRGGRRAGRAAVHRLHQAQRGGADGGDRRCACAGGLRLGGRAGRVQLRRCAWAAACQSARWVGAQPGGAPWCVVPARAAGGAQLALDLRRTPHLRRPGRRRPQPDQGRRGALAAARCRLRRRAQGGCWAAQRWRSPCARARRVPTDRACPSPAAAPLPSLAGPHLQRHAKNEHVGARAWGVWLQHSAGQAALRAAGRRLPLPPFPANPYTQRASPAPAAPPCRSVFINRRYRHRLRHAPGIDKIQT